MRDLRYDRHGADLICKGCYASSKGPAAAKDSLRHIPAEQLEPTGPRMRDASDLLNYYCYACRYKFSRKANFQFENCPSCGKIGSVRRHATMTSSQLLEESDDVFG